MRTATGSPTSSPPLSLLDRRSEPRFPSSEPAATRLLNAPPGNDIGTRVLNMSRSGLKLQLHQPMDVGTWLEITLRNMFLIGEVRYCHAVNGDFHAGILVREAKLIPPGQAHSIPV